MLRDTLSEFAYTPWSLAGLIFFVLMFVLLLAWVYRKGSDDQYQEISRLPLEDETGFSNHEFSERS